MRFRHPISALVLASLVALAAIGCGTNGPSTDPLTEGCPTGGAQISVNDATLQRVCGCAETDNVLFVAPQALTCTVPRGTVVFFQYASVAIQHQMASVGTPSFPASPLSDPEDPSGVHAYGVKLSAPGTYVFQDLLDTAINGRIIVQ